MSTVEDAARLRALADALEVEGMYEAELAAAKAAYRKSPDDEKAKDRARAAGAALAAARTARRGDVVTVGGDATRSED